jgi:uncharacterized protein
VEIPTRTCLVCRRTAPKTALIRLAAVHGTVQVDPLATQQTRGAYVCATPECAAAAARSDGAAVARALRTGRNRVDVEVLRAALDAERKRREEDQQGDGLAVTRSV